MAFELPVSNELCNQVRAAIDISLSADTLSNETIGSDIFWGEALGRVNSAIDGILDDTQISAKTAELQRATIFYAAGLIAPRIRLISRENLEGDELQWQNQDLNKLAANLTANGDNAINRALAAANSPIAKGVQNVFATAKSNYRRRGNLNG